MPRFVVCALYQFTPVDDPAGLQAPLRQVMLDNDVRGTLILAAEGINGTVAGPRAGIDALLDWLRAQPPFTGLSHKESLSEQPPFRRTRVKLKREIVTMGVPGIDPRASAGTYLDAAQWNTLLDDPEVLLIDTRNDYEYRVGSFQNAVNPGTRSFREFPAFVQQHLDKGKHRKVAMFCTGGIRCEKSTAYLKGQGFEEVYHLRGGILKYLEDTDSENSRWQGECFVFDERVTVDQDLQPGSYQQCNACRMPVSDTDRASPLYQPGVSCPHCHDTLSEAQKERFRERQKQMELAQRRGESHLGDDVADTARRNRLNKQACKERQRQHATAMITGVTHDDRPATDR